MWKSASMFVIVMLLGVAACATTPKTAEDRQDLIVQAERTLADMRRIDPGLDQVLASSAGYAVFPNIGKGGLIVGGAHGRGVAFQQGRPIGYVQINELSVGAQAGGQSFAELVVFHTPETFNELLSGKFQFGANASVVALTAGAAAATDFRSGTTVYVLPRGGLMVDVSVAGQKLNYKPLSG